VQVKRYDVVHEPMPVWVSPQGQRYCSNFNQHGAWVTWPCEDNDPEETPSE
jgi:hypothetical protein